MRNSVEKPALASSINQAVTNMNTPNKLELRLTTKTTAAPLPPRTHRIPPWAILSAALLSAVAARADYKSTVLASHPVGYWPLNLAAETNKNAGTGNYIAADLSGNGNFGDYINIAPKNGQNTNGPSIYLNSSVIFDGANTYVDLSVGSNTALLNIVGPISMEAWVQATIPQNQYGLILSKGYDLSQMVDDIDLHIISTDNSHTAYYYWGGIYTSYNGLSQQSAQGAATTTNWQHVVATWKQISGTNGLWSLYVNGLLAVTNMAVGPALYAPPFEQGFAFTDPWAIGNGTADGATSGRLFTGNLCHLALYTNALTAAEVQNHYEIGMYGAPLTPYERVVRAGHPVGYWPLNLAAETNKNAVTGNYIAEDLSGNQNFGDYINLAPKNGQSAPGPSSYITNAVSFDGATTYVDLSVGNSTPLLDVVGPITMEAWVKAVIPQNQYGLILSKGYDLNQSVDDIDLHIISTDDSHTAYYYWGGIYTSYNGLGQQSAQGAPTSTNWQHVVATWEQISGTNGLWSLYTNGVLAVTNMAVGPALYAPPFEQGFAFTDPWAIGNGTADGGTSGRLFTGDLSHVALYTNALSAAEIMTHYEVGFYGLPSLSVAHGASGQIVISWADSVSPLFGLQQWSALGGSWSPVAASVQHSNSTYQVILTPGASSTLYRLSLP